MGRIVYELWPRKRLWLRFVPRSRHAAKLVMEDILRAVTPRFGEQREEHAEARRQNPHIELVRISHWNEPVDAAMRERLEALLTEAAPGWRRYYEIRAPSFGPPAGFNREQQLAWLRYYGLPESWVTAKK